MLPLEHVKVAAFRAEIYDNIGASIYYRLESRGAIFIKTCFIYDWTTLNPRNSLAVENCLDLDGSLAGDSLKVFTKTSYIFYWKPEALGILPSITLDELFAPLQTNYLAQVSLSKGVS